jgi:very-short-patch-repair endonuclease
MWIKSQDGDYYNMDMCREIYLDREGYTYFRFDNCCVGTLGDNRETVIANIISGTPVLEV